VQLADAAQRRYSGADVRYRRVYLAPGSSSESTRDDAPPVITRSTIPSPDLRRRRPLSDGPRNGPLEVGSPEPDPPARQPEPAKTDDSDQGGWRRLKPGEKP